MDFRPFARASPPTCGSEQWAARRVMASAAVAVTDGLIAAAAPAWRKSGETAHVIGNGPGAPIAGSPGGPAAPDQPCRRLGGRRRGRPGPGRGGGSDAWRAARRAVLP